MICSNNLEKFDLVGLNFANYLQTQEYESIRKESRISIHVETGDIFFDDKSYHENVYSFMEEHQNYEIKI